MANEVLSAVLTGEDSGLSKAINDIKDSVEELNDNLQETVVSATAANAALSSLDKRMGRLDQNMSGLSGSSNATRSTLLETAVAVDALGDVASVSSGDMSKLASSIDDAGVSMSSFDDESSENTSSISQMLNKTDELQNAFAQITEISDDKNDKLDIQSNKERENAESAGLLAGTMRRLNNVLSSTTLNIGAFNLNLSNMAVVLPAIVGLLGTATVAMGGFLTMIAGVVGLIGAGAFVGFAQDLNDIQQNSSEINSLFGAMEEKMSRIRDSIEEAASPITEAGDAFQDFADQVGGDLLWALSEFLRHITESLDLITRLYDAISEPLGANFNKTLDQFNQAIEILLPSIRSFVSYVSKNLGDLLVFLATQFQRMSGDLGNLVKSFIRFAKEATKLTITLLKGLAPVISIILDGVTMLMSGLNRLPESVLSSIAAFGAIIFALARLKEFLGSVVDEYGDAIANALEFDKSLEKITDSIYEQTEALSEYIQKLRETGSAIKNVSNAPNAGLRKAQSSNLQRHLSEGDSGINMSEGGANVLSSAVSSLLPFFVSLSDIFSILSNSISKLISIITPLQSSMLTLSSISTTLATAFGSLAAGVAAVLFFVFIIVDAFDILSGTLSFLAKIGKVVVGIFDVLGSVLNFVFTTVVAIVRIFRAVINVLGDMIIKGLGLDHVFSFVMSILSKIITALKTFADWIDEIAAKINKYSLGILGGSAERQDEEPTARQAKAAADMGIISEEQAKKATSNDSAKSSTSAEGMKNGKTVVNNNQTYNTNVNQQVKEEEMSAKQKRLLKEAMQEFDKESNRNTSGTTG